MTVSEIRYACFISYCHGQGKLMSRFITELRDGLRDSIEPYMDLEVFLDSDRLQVGYRYNEALGKAICQSLCMVSVFVPKYLEHDYCRRELQAMQLADRRRRRSLGGAPAGHHGCVIPIVLRGNIGDLPDTIKGHVHCGDFSRFTTADRHLSYQKSFVTKIDDIAKYVYELYRNVGHVAIDCSQFSLPTSKQANRWKPPVAVNSSPQPLREPGR